jgi:hypothetical protein
MKKKCFNNWVLVSWETIRVLIDSGYTVSGFEKQTSAYSRYFLLYPDIETRFIEEALMDYIIHLLALILQKR